jgi:hypothetical protein
MVSGMSSTEAKVVPRSPGAVPALADAWGVEAGFCGERDGPSIANPAAAVTAALADAWGVEAGVCGERDSASIAKLGAKVIVAVAAAIATNIKTFFIVFLLLPTGYYIRAIEYALILLAVRAVSSSLSGKTSVAGMVQPR